MWCLIRRRHLRNRAPGVERPEETGDRGQPRAKALPEIDGDPRRYARKRPERLPRNNGVGGRSMKVAGLHPAPFRGYPTLPADRMVETVTRFTLFLLAAGCVSAQQQPNGLYAIFNTPMGNITARLYEKDTPMTVENFVALAQGTKATLNPKTGTMLKVPLYDNITFHRVVPGEMIQSGDPTGSGSLIAASRFATSFCPDCGSIAQASSPWPTVEGRIRAAASFSSLPIPCAYGTASIRSLAWW
jgi:hypothetical protein